MTPRITIIWDGNVSGLAEHKISLAAFGEPLLKLHQAIRRIASQIVTNAVNKTELSSGRLANLARQIDIEVVDLAKSSSGIVGEIAFYPAGGYQGGLFGDLPELASMELLDSIEQESQGKPRNASVRSFLESLPLGITVQRYGLTDDKGQPLRPDVVISEMHIADFPRPLPTLLEYVGTVIGVGFEPGKPEVRLKTNDSQVVFSATAEQVDKALEYRHEAVRIIGVAGAHHKRILRLDKAEAPAFEATDKQIDSEIVQRWDELLRRLAK